MSSLECKKCGRWVENVGEDAKSVTCSICVLQAVGMPEEKKSYQPTGRPPGWHFMSEFVDKDTLEGSILFASVYLLYSGETSTGSPS